MSPACGYPCRTVHPSLGLFFVSSTLAWAIFELTHDTRTRKIRARSDLWHDVWHTHTHTHTHTHMHICTTNSSIDVGLAQACPNYLWYQLDGKLVEWRTFWGKPEETSRQCKHTVLHTMSNVWISDCSYIRHKNWVDRLKQTHTSFCYTHCTLIYHTTYSVHMDGWKYSQNNVVPQVYTQVAVTLLPYLLHSGKDSLQSLVPLVVIIHGRYTCT